MRRIVKIIAASAAVSAAVGGSVIVWRRNPRVGTTFMNTVVNPSLLRRGLAGGGVSELGTIEHVGRKSGVRRLTPVHPEPTPVGFRVVVPLGSHSEWARNVLAAGHCRLQLHDVVYDLDEPTMVAVSAVESLPGPIRSVMAGLGFQYLKLRTFGASHGSLEPAMEQVAVATQPGLGETATGTGSGELVSSAR